MKRESVQVDIAASMIVSLAFVGAASGAPASEIFDGSRIIIIDGDTVALPCARPAPGCSEKVRLLDIDAPETRRPSCDAELQMSLAAKDVLAEMVRAGPVEVVRSGRLDRWGRTLGRLKTLTGDAGQALLKDRLVLLYRTGATEKAARIAHWCGGR